MPIDNKEGPVLTSAEVGLFERVFLRYYPMVYRLAYRCLGQRDETEDIAHEVFLRFYTSPPHTSNEEQQRAWLCRVTINLGLNALRTRKRRFGHEQCIDALTENSIAEGVTMQNPEQYVRESRHHNFLRI